MFVKYSDTKVDKIYKTDKTGKKLIVEDKEDSTMEEKAEEQNAEENGTDKLAEKN